mgnify:FL=1
MSWLMHGAGSCQTVAHGLACTPSHALNLHTVDAVTAVPVCYWGCSHAQAIPKQPLKKASHSVLCSAHPPASVWCKCSCWPVRLNEIKLANTGAGSCASWGSGGGGGGGGLGSTCSSCLAGSLLALGWGSGCGWLGCWGVGLGASLRLSRGGGLGPSLGCSLWGSLDRGCLGVWGGSSLGWGSLPQPVGQNIGSQSVLWCRCAQDHVAQLLVYSTASHDGECGCACKARVCAPCNSDAGLAVHSSLTFVEK